MQSSAITQDSRLTIEHFILTLFINETRSPAQTTNKRIQSYGNDGETGEEKKKGWRRLTERMGNVNEQKLSGMKSRSKKGGREKGGTDQRLWLGCVRSRRKGKNGDRRLEKDGP